MASPEGESPTEDRKQQETSGENPDQQSKTLGRHDEAAKNDIPVFKPSGGKALRTFTIIIIVLLLILAGLFGWLWWQERYGDSEDETSGSSSNSQQESEETAECPINFTIYANESLGVEFCYPTVWGDVTVNDAKFEDADSGSRWRLSFADKSQVNLGLVSGDWNTNVPRDGTCVDPAVQTLPPFSPFSTEWEVETEVDTDPPQPSSAVRGIEVEEDKYLIEERVDNLLTNGACITGYTVIDNETYPFASSTYHYGPLDDVSVQMYMDNPDDYVSETERADFATFVKSVKAFEE